MARARAVVARNVVPLRAEPDDGAEMISQAIFGETVIPGDTRGSYTEVETPDAYRGWAYSSDLVILETGERYPNPARAAMTASLFLPVFRDADGRSERLTLLTLGTVVELAAGEEGQTYYPIRFPDGRIGFVESEALIVPSYPEPTQIGPNLVIVARGMIGVPYLWGGRTPFGMDCSGFTQRVYFLCGRIIPRDAWQQAESADFEPVDLADLRAGDLVFFAGRHDPLRRGITHVGIAQADGRIIHADPKRGVAITTLEEALESRDWRGARRLRVV